MTSRTLPGRILLGNFWHHCTCTTRLCCNLPARKGFMPVPGQMFPVCRWGQQFSLRLYPGSSHNSPANGHIGSTHIRILPCHTCSANGHLSSTHICHTISTATPVHPTVTSAVHTSTIPPVIEIAPSTPLLLHHPAQVFLNCFRLIHSLSELSSLSASPGFIIWIYRHDIAGIKFRSFYGLLAFSASHRSWNFSNHCLSYHG